MAPQSCGVLIVEYGGSIIKKYFITFYFQKDIQITALVQKLQKYSWMCPGVTCIFILYYLSYKNYPFEV